MKSIILGLVITAFSFSQVASAGILVEPYAGMGQAKVSGDAETETESSTVLGARLGMTFVLLNAGIDYQMNNAENMEITNTSAFLGVKLPLVRAWAEYIFNSDVDHDNTDSKIDLKSGYGLGVGFTGLPLVSINLEVETLKYEIGDDFDFDVATTILSVSFPLSF